ncbi:hypothetical protein VTK56DRAFT_5422 [Thermocarpiscus australiensis]
MSHADVLPVLPDMLPYGTVSVPSPSPPAQGRLSRLCSSGWELQWPIVYRLGMEVVSQCLPVRRREVHVCLQKPPFHPMSHSKPGIVLKPQLPAPERHVEECRSQHVAGHILSLFMHFLSVGGLETVAPSMVAMPSCQASMPNLCSSNFQFPSLLMHQGAPCSVLISFSH